jgi:hypothetical protein
MRPRQKSKKRPSIRRFLLAVLLAVVGEWLYSGIFLDLFKHPEDRFVGAAKKAFKGLGQAAAFQGVTAGSRLLSHRGSNIMCSAPEYNQHGFK